jgi:endonuclease/exonuclease/phosphatase family metal-dependent hydrolase
MDQIHGPHDLFRLLGQQISKLGGGAVPRYAPWREPAEHLVRIGAFNTDQLDEARMKDPRVAAVMFEIIRQFDVVALQELDTTSPFAVKRFLKALNGTGRDFQIVSAPLPAPDRPRQSLAILYDASTVELVDGHHYQVNDPDEIVACDPLVAWFRTRAEQGAFTFTLVNVQFDPHSKTDEILQISQIFRAVRNDGRGEDDVILAGDFGVTAAQLNETATTHGLQAVNVDAATATNGTAQGDNLMLDPLATSEFTGETGVFDFMKVYNLTLTEALSISDHLPVWADFEVFENTAPGRFANRGTGDSR